MRAITLFMILSLILLSFGCSRSNLSGQVAYMLSECQLHNGSCYNDTCPDGFVDVAYSCNSNAVTTTSATTSTTSIGDGLNAVTTTTLATTTTIALPTTTTFVDDDNFVSTSTLATTTTRKSSTTTTTTKTKPITGYVTGDVVADIQPKTVCCIPDTFPPNMAWMQITNITNSSAAIQWQTDEASQGEIYYGTTISYGNTKQITTLSSLHSAAITSLLSAKKYYFAIKNCDRFGNCNISSRGSFETMNTTNNLVTVTNLTNKSGILYQFDFEAASAGWSTNALWERGKPSKTSTETSKTCSENCGENVSCYVECHGNGGPGNAHSGTNVWGTDLDDYYSNNGTFWLQSQIFDFSGQQNVQVSFYEWLEIELSGEDYLNSTPPTYDEAYFQYRLNGGQWQNVRALETGAPREDDKWYLYMDDADYADMQPSVQWRWLMKTDEWWQWAGWYIDDFVISSSAVDSSAPAISNVEATNTGLNTVAISWRTNEESTSKVTYGKTAIELSNNQQNSELVTEHSITLSNLEANTIYYFSLQSTDKSGNTATDNNGGNYYTFSTVVIVDTQAPIISSLQVNDIQYNTARIVWSTDEDSSGRVNFGRTKVLGSSKISTDLSKSHSIRLTNLQPSSLYYFMALSSDASGNAVSSEILNFTTKENLTYIPQMLQTTTTMSPTTTMWKVNGSITTTTIKYTTTTTLITATCNEKQGFICKPEIEYCGGEQLTVSDTDYCCSEECQPVVCNNVKDCGLGFFNVCDRVECGSCQENGYFNELILLGIKFGFGNCNKCVPATTCEDYKYDLITCENDPCDLGNCNWGKFSCQSK